MTPVTASDLAATFRPLREHRTQYLYACEFSDGLVKVGRTDNPQVRFGTLMWDKSRRGSSLVGVFCVEVATGSLVSAEAELVARMRRITPAHDGRREWFSGVAFRDAMQLVADIADERSAK